MFSPKRTKWSMCLLTTARQFLQVFEPLCLKNDFCPWKMLETHPRFNILTITRENMPALRLFGRAWLIACDDLVAPAALGVLVRGSWLGVLLAFAYAYEGDSLACPVAQCDWMLGLGCLWGYTAGSIVLVGSSAVLEVAPNTFALQSSGVSRCLAGGTPIDNPLLQILRAAHNTLNASWVRLTRGTPNMQVALMSASARGTPMQPEARRGVAPLLYMHIGVSLCEAAWAVRTFFPLIPTTLCLAGKIRSMREPAAVHGPSISAYQPSSLI